MSRYLVIILSLFVFSCDRSAGPTTTNPVYFDVAGYVKQQIQTLSAQKPTINKTASIRASSNSQITQAVDWAKELELFVQADINKPAFRNSYTINRPDSLTYQYRLRSGEEKLTVRALTVQLDSATRRPARITATLRTDNPLYHSERRLLLESGPRKNTKWGIIHYQIEGFQQLTYFERSDFQVDGRIPEQAVRNFR